MFYSGISRFHTRIPQLAEYPICSIREGVALDDMVDPVLFQDTWVSKSGYFVILTLYFRSYCIPYAHHLPFSNIGNRAVIAHAPTTSL
jgi:hypothetical protein